MKWMQVQKILMTHGVKILAAMLGAGVIGTAAVQSRMDDNAFSPSGHSRAILQNEVVYPGEEERTRANGEGDGKDAWEKAEELLEEKLAQSDAADSALFDESRIAGRIEDANVLVGDFEDDLSDRKDRGTDSSSKQTSHGQLDGRSVYVRDNNAQDGSPVIPALNRDRIVGRTGDNTADDGRNGKNGLTTGRNDSRRSTGTSETSNGGSEYSGYDRRQRSDNAEAASADDRTRVITPALDPTKPVVKTPEEERIERLREEYKQYDFVIPESHPANIGYTTSISEKRLARMKEEQGKSEAIVTINEFDFFNPRKFTTSDVLDAATILYAYDVKLDYVTINQSDQKINRLTSYQIDNPDLENVKVVIEDVFDKYGNKTHCIVQVIVNYGPNYEYTASGEREIELYDERVIFVDEDGKEIGSRYYNNDDTCIVNEFESPIYGPGASVEPTFMEGDEQYISELCEGVSDTPNGELIDRFIVSPEGRIDGKRVLYAKKNYKVPDNWRIKREYSDELSKETRYFAVLCSTGDSDEDVIVPPGIEVVRGEIKAKSLTISSEVQKIDLSNAVVKEEFHVSEDNPYFSVTEDGLLTDKAGKTLYGVPAEKKETIVIPAEIEEIACNFADEQTVEFSGNEQPSWQDIQEEMSQNQTLKIVLPKDSYLEYLRKWRMDETAMSNVYIKDEEASLKEQQIYVEQDGSVVQRLDGEENKLRLLRIPADISYWGYYVVPDTVEEIAEGAISEKDTLGALIVQESVKTIDETVLQKDKIGASVYLMHTEKAPEIKKNDNYHAPTVDFDNLSQKQKDYIINNRLRIVTLNSEIQRQLESYIDSEDKARTVVPDDKVIRIYNGNVYTVQLEEGKRPALTLMRANPAAKTFFEEDIPKDCDLIMVNDSAFANCKNLQLVELPETTTVIGGGAFKGCDNLEGVLAKTSDDLYTVPDVFDGCDNLRFFATNATSPYEWDYYNGSIIGVSESFRKWDELTQTEKDNKPQNEKLGFVRIYGETDLETDLEKLQKEKDNLSTLNILYANDYFMASSAEEQVQYSLQKAGDGYILLAKRKNEETANGQYDPDCIVVSATTNVSGEIKLGGANTIGVQAFEGCTSRFTIAKKDWNGIAEFWQESFKNATGFEGISENGIPTGKVTLGENGLAADEEGNLLGSFLFVGEHAFENCTAIQSAEITLGEKGWSRDFVPYARWESNLDGVPEVRMETFAGCTKLTEVTFVPGAESRRNYVDQIKFGAFAGTEVKKLKIPDSVTVIEAQSFGQNMNHLDFYIPTEGRSVDDGLYMVPTLRRSSNYGKFESADTEFAFRYPNDENANEVEITFNGKTGEECLEIASAFIMQWRYNMLGYTDEVLESWVEDDEDTKDGEEEALKEGEESEGFEENEDNTTYKKVVEFRSAPVMMYLDYYYKIYQQRSGELLEELRNRYSKQPADTETAENEDSLDQTEEERAEKLKNETIQLIRTAILDRVDRAENKLKEMMGVASNLSELDEKIGYVSAADEIDAAIQWQKQREVENEKQDEESNNSYFEDTDKFVSESAMLANSLAIDLSGTTDVSRMLEELQGSIATETDMAEIDSKDDEVQPEVAKSEFESAEEEAVETRETLNQLKSEEDADQNEKLEAAESDTVAENVSSNEDEVTDAMIESEETITATEDVEDAELAEEKTADDTVLDAVDNDSSDENLTETVDEVPAEATSTEVEASTESGETTEDVTAEKTTTVEENSSDAEN